MELKPNDQQPKWNKEKCYIEALKYQSKPEYKKKSQPSYIIAYKNGWLDEICSHMICKNKHNYWTKDKCIKQANKYNTKKEFLSNSPVAYTISNKNKWLNDICKHMTTLGNLYKRCIYVYEFSNNYAYIGLTFNIQKRDYDHNNNQNSNVYKHKISYNLTPKLIQLTEYINNEEAINLEKQYILQYKNDNWNILNIAKGGSLGYNCKALWTKERCHEIALKYKTRSEFSKYCSNVYHISIKNKWLNDICIHMTQLSLPKGYWTKE